ncbi:voltage-dependent calcium channel unc-36 [Plakobranchus ocellatus]|uniref:Voltage-dependent calcium channel unc-36 n=1 Tax=Plakobranchus ocellatus TaxID=259542 RepID=A0AAV4DEC2_9GAST|nr:voltage-dependent calcium channel unc-36 [Plakobranchus ocellatus]
MPVCTSNKPDCRLRSSYISGRQKTFTPGKRLPRHQTVCWLWPSTSSKKCSAQINPPMTSTTGSRCHSTLATDCVHIYAYDKEVVRKGADEVTSMLAHYFAKFVPDSVPTLKLFCKSCCGQDKNYTMVSYAVTRYQQNHPWGRRSCLPFGILSQEQKYGEDPVCRLVSCHKSRSMEKILFAVSYPVTRAEVWRRSCLPFGILSQEKYGDDPVCHLVSCHKNRSMEKIPFAVSYPVTREEICKLFLPS